MPTPALYSGHFVRFCGSVRILIKPTGQREGRYTYAGRVEIPEGIVWEFSDLSPSPFQVRTSLGDDHARNIDGAAIAACGFVGYTPSDADSDGHHEEAIVDAFNNHADVRHDDHENKVAISRREGGRTVKVAP
jgi:hypothetical protein